MVLWIAVTGLAFLVFASFVVNVAAHKRIAIPVRRSEPTGFLAKPSPPNTIRHVIAVDNTSDRIQNFILGVDRAIFIDMLSRLLRKYHLPGEREGGFTNDHPRNFYSSNGCRRFASPIGCIGQIIVGNKFNSVKNKDGWGMAEIFQRQVNVGSELMVGTIEKLKGYWARLPYPRSFAHDQGVMGDVSSILAFAENEPGYYGVTSNKEQREGRYHKLKIFAACMFVFGIGLNFYGMWNLQIGPDDWRGVVSVIIGLACFMYGFGLFIHCIA
jgi:hypothetical protein